MATNASDGSACIADGGILHEWQRYLELLGPKSHCFSALKLKPEQWQEIKWL
jgi:hypothetical protein